MTLLKKNKGNISHAAREADIDRKYFRKLMRKYGIEGGGDSTTKPTTRSFESVTPSAGASHGSASPRVGARWR